MSRRVTRTLAALLCAVLLPAASLRAQNATAPERKPDLTAERSTYDYETKQLVLTGRARLSLDDVVLTADEIRYDGATKIASAKGHFVLMRAGSRLVADEGTYDLGSRRMRVRNLRVGQFPVYLSGESVEGTFDRLEFTNATIFFRENASYAPSIKARRVVYEKGWIAAGEGLELGVLGFHLFNLPKFEHDLQTELISYFNGKIGYRRSLGLFGEAELRIPVAPGLRLGGDAGIYTARGLMAGPAATYLRRQDGGDFVQGSLRSGYINDRGERLTDLLGRPVPADRSHLEWWHRQQIGNFTLNGEFNYWSDSEILRDFRPKLYFPVQQPDSFLEATYTGENYVVSAFTRLHPNRFHLVQERLPEVRFDLLPSAAPAGFYERLNASFALLQQDAYLTAPEQKSTRLDVYYGLERPIAPTPWFTFTPVAGGRFTHYADAVGGKNEYTRTFGEVGFDARLRASATFDYKNPNWDIDGLRHLVEPRLSYRYAPEAASGARYIPAIDRRVFATYLQPLSLADQRNVDQLERLDTLRLELRQTLQTRDATYGSRDLATLDIAADYRFSRRAGQRPLTDLHTALAVNPARWMSLEVYERFTPQTRQQQELNYAIEFTDQEYWSARLSSHFLRGDYQEYGLDYRQRINEVFDVVGRWRYDTQRSRFNEQTYGIWQRLGQTWAIKYEVSLFEGRRRESSFGFNVEVDLLKF